MAGQRMGAPQQGFASSQQALQGVGPFQQQTVPIPYQPLPAGVPHSLLPSGYFSTMQAQQAAAAQAAMMARRPGVLSGVPGYWVNGSFSPVSGGVGAGHGAAAGGGASGGGATGGS